MKSDITSTDNLKMKPKIPHSQKDYLTRKEFYGTIIGGGLLLDALYGGDIISRGIQEAGGFSGTMMYLASWGNLFGYEEGKTILKGFTEFFNGPLRISECLAGVLKLYVTTRMPNTKNNSQ